MKTEHDGPFADSLKRAIRKAGDEYDISITNRQIELVDASVSVLKATAAAIENS